MPSRWASYLYPFPLFGAAFALGIVLSSMMCSSQDVPPGQNVANNGPCSYPRGCYLIEKSGPHAGQCADCTGGPARCRVYYHPTPGQPTPLDMGGVFVPAGADLGGTTLPIPGGPPAITDQAVLCGLYAPPSLPENTQAVCAAVESLCIARGPLCNGGACVHKKEATGCASTNRIEPQRRPGMPGQDTYCPYDDDICCPAMTDGGMGDGSMGDGSMPDGGVVDAAPRDA